MIINFIIIYDPTSIVSYCAYVNKKSFREFFTYLLNLFRVQIIVGTLAAVRGVFLFRSSNLSIFVKFKVQGYLFLNRRGSSI